MSVVYRVIKTELEKKCRKAGGKSISQALKDATANLTALSAQTMIRMDEGLARITDLVGDVDLRASADNLSEIHQVADELLGLCGTLQRPGLCECLLAICRLADAVTDSETWLPGTFGPLLIITRLTAKGGLSQREISVLLESVDRCIDLYLAASSVERRATSIA